MAMVGIDILPQYSTLKFYLLMLLPTFIPVAGALKRVFFCLNDELTLPLDSISVEMVFRGIYHFTRAFN